MAARYEDLRSAALGGRVRGGHGLALLASRGMAAWMAAWRSLPEPTPPARAPAGPPPDGVVAVLAAMTAACLAGR